MRVALLFALLGGMAQAEVPAAHRATLARGINVTHWFRFPPRNDPAALQAYMADAQLQALKRAGFTYIRLPVQPEIVQQPDGRLEPQRQAALLQAVRRIQAAGLGVMIEPHPHNWSLETSEPQRRQLLAFWRNLAPQLRGLPTALTFPEVVNEPVYPNAAAAWAGYQQELLAAIRESLPQHTVILTGANWGSLDGLRALQPVADRNVVYTFHTYEPQILTTMAAFEQGLDRAALGRLPFPVRDRGACEASLEGSSHGRTRDIGRWYCSQGWNEQKVARDIIAGAAEWARRHNAVVAMTEFGASHQMNGESRQRYLQALREAADAAGIPWALWGLDDGMGFPLRINAAEPLRLDAGTLRALGLQAR